MFEVICFSLFIISVFMIINQRGHFFMVLLSFEAVTLRLFFLSVRTIVGVGGGPSLLFSLVFLVFRVCEASLGLGLLVRSMRCQGFDYVKGILRLKF